MKPGKQALSDKLQMLCQSEVSLILTRMRLV
jgi:hypothetical protein